MLSFMTCFCDELSRFHQDTTFELLWLNLPLFNEVFTNARIVIGRGGLTWSMSWKVKNQTIFDHELAEVAISNFCVTGFLNFIVWYSSGSIRHLKTSGMITFSLSAGLHHSLSITHEYLTRNDTSWQTYPHSRCDGYHSIALSVTSSHFTLVCTCASARKEDLLLLYIKASCHLGISLSCLKWYCSTSWHLTVLFEMRRSPVDEGLCKRRDVILTSRRVLASLVLKVDC